MKENITLINGVKLVTNSTIFITIIISLNTDEWHLIKYYSRLVTIPYKALLLIRHKTNKHIGADILGLRDKIRARLSCLLNGTQKLTLRILLYTKQDVTLRTSKTTNRRWTVSKDRSRAHGVRSRDEMKKVKINWCGANRTLVSHKPIVGTGSKESALRQSATCKYFNWWYAEDKKAAITIAFLISTEVWIPFKC